MANEKDFFTESPDDLYIELNGIFNSTGLAAVGYDGDDSASWKGGFRMAGITQNGGDTLNEAILSMIPSVREGDQQIKFIIRGIKEANTSDFSGGSPFGRTLTTASATGTYDISGIDTTTRINVKSIVEEILNVGGWSNGNHMGFVIDDNGTTTGSGNEYVFWSDAILSIRHQAEPNFTPTPITVAAPTFPQPDEIGMKVSMPGFDVRTAASDKLLFDSNQQVMKISQQTLVTCTAGVEKIIAHGLGYRPKVLVYARNNGKSMLLPRFGFTVDPVGADGIYGSYSVDATNLRIYVSNAAGSGSIDVYYYIFIDEQTT